MLKIPPHPSFVQPKDQGFGEHIIYNPPSSAPSVYHTPFKFLPKTDPRRQANLSQLLVPDDDPLTLAPLATKRDGLVKKHNVTKEEVEEMRQLRMSDPLKWSVVKLAEKYNCSSWFVMMCCTAPEEHNRAERERLQAIKDRWGPIRRRAREERDKRRVLLHRDEL